MTEADAELLPVGMLTVASRLRRQADKDGEQMTSDSPLESTEATEEMQVTEFPELLETTELPESTEITVLPASSEDTEIIESIAGLDEFADPEESEFVPEFSKFFFLIQFVNRNLYRRLI